MKCPFCGEDMVPGAMQTKPMDDHWEEKGFLDRRKKPDWEK